jgi:predicted porin
MQKKLIAVAVAGALGVPAVALAQTSTVTISGRAYIDYGYVNMGADKNGLNRRVKSDTLQAPGSMIRISAEEKLGGGLSAWYQCESSAGIRGEDQDGWCGRDSALGLKGNFGNVFFGNWGTPFKRSRDYTGANDTGHFGVSTLLTGFSTTTLDGANNAGLFSRRQNNSLNYDTPSMGGFKGMVSYSALNTQTGVAANAIPDKPRVFSIGGGYANGPLKLGAAWEKHSQFYNNGVSTGDEKGWLISGSYTFGGSVTVGGMYTQQKAELAGANAKVRAYSVGVDWKLGGPHSIRANYTNAGDMKGTAGFNIGRRPATGPDSGAYMAQARYFYALSKRTEVGVGFNRLNNDSNAGYRISSHGGSGAGGQIGAKHTAFAMSLDHRF